MGSKCRGERRAFGVVRKGRKGKATRRSEAEESKKQHGNTLPPTRNNLVSDFSGQNPNNMALTMVMLSAAVLHREAGVQVILPSRKIPARQSKGKGDQALAPAPFALGASM